MIHPGERYRDKFQAIVTVIAIDDWIGVITARRHGTQQQLPFSWWHTNVVGRSVGDERSKP